MGDKTVSKELTDKMRDKLAAGLAKGDRIAALEEMVEACKADAREAEAYAAELEAKLAKAVEALGEVATHRKKCHEYDDDVGHERRTFDVEDMIIMEYAASTTLAELKGQDDE